MAIGVPPENLGLTRDPGGLRVAGVPALLHAVRGRK